MTIQSSYKDNPYLQDVVVKEIERLKEANPDFWQIYGEGNYGTIRGKIYNKIKPITLSEFDSVVEDFCIYGLDYGQVSPCALVKVKIKEDTIFVHQMLYMKAVETDDVYQDIADLLSEDGAGDNEIYVDSHENV